MSAEMGTLEQLEALREEVRRHQELYYQHAAPVLTDAQFDALFAQLQALEAQHPDLVTAQSPTQRVGGSVASGFEPVRHLMPMLSIGNASDQAQAQAFVARICQQLAIAPAALQMVGEPKYDGLSLSLRYFNGRLLRAVTRGDGDTGEDVTAQARAIANIPQEIEALRDVHLIEIRGEVLMLKSDFLALNQRLVAAGEEELANPRNAAAGALRQKDPAVTARRSLQFMAYGIGAARGEVQTREGHGLPALQSQRLQWLQGLGFTVSSEVLTCMADGIQGVFESLTARRDALPFEVDGVVFKVDCVALQDQLGWRSRTPHWAVAYKFPPQEAVTRLLSIDVQVGRTGSLTPVARLQPVRVGGVVVENATLHNVDFIALHDLRVGDDVCVYRAGDVIPRVVATALAKDPARPGAFVMAQACPMCGSAVVRASGKAKYRCSGGFACRAQREAGLIHFASRLAMDIEGMGDSTVAALVNEGLVDGPAALYSLSVDQVERLEGFARVSASRLVDNIAASKGRPLHRFLFALGIEGVGESTAKELAHAFASWASLAQADLAALLAVPSVGATTANSLYRYLHDEPTAHAVAQLAEIVAPASVQRSQAGGALANKTFVVTGTLSVPREQIKAAIEAAGGKVAGSVSAKISALIAGEDAGSKLDKARTLGVPVWDEAQLMTLLGEAAVAA